MGGNRAGNQVCCHDVNFRPPRRSLPGDETEPKLSWRALEARLVAKEPGPPGGRIPIHDSWLGVCRVISAFSACLAGPSCADTPGDGLVISSYPPAAQISENGQYLGLAGQPLPLRPGPHDLVLTLEDHFSQQISVSLRHFEGDPHPVVVLEPDSLAVWLQDVWMYRRGLALGLLGLAGLGVWGGGRVVGRLESARKRRTIEQYRTSAPEVPERSLIAQKVGEYQILAPLGEGGMAEVYLGVPSGGAIEDAVAIKVLNRELRDRSESRARFEREITVSSRLTHPNIVEVRDYGWYGDRMYLAMERVDGLELRDHLSQLPGDWPRVRSILDQVLTAVDYAHQQGVAHRDLKPGNIKITAGGQVKVMDFGLARAVDSVTLTETNSTP